MLNLGAGLQLRLMLFWSNFKWILILFVCLTGVIIIYLAYPSLTNHQNTNSSENQNMVMNVDGDDIQAIKRAIKSGDYDKAMKELKIAIIESPDDGGLKKLQSQLTDELKVEFKFNYLPDRRKELVSKGNATPVLTAKDPYYLSLSISGESYIYIFQHQSSGDLIQLFPNKDFAPVPNPHTGGSLRIPDGYDWLYLDNIPGTELIYLVASKWRQEEIEELSSRLSATINENWKMSITETLVNRLLIEKESAEKLPGLVYGEYQFKHVHSTEK